MVETLALPLTQLYKFLASLTPLTAVWLAVFTLLSLSLLIRPSPVQKPRRTHVQWAIVKARQECRSQDIKVLQDAANDFLPEWFDDLRSSWKLWAFTGGSLMLIALFWPQVNFYADVLVEDARNFPSIAYRVFLENEKLITAATPIIIAATILTLGWQARRLTMLVGLAMVFVAFAVLSVQEITGFGFLDAAGVVGLPIGFAASLVLIPPYRPRFAVMDRFFECLDTVKEWVAKGNVQEVVAEPEPEDTTNRTMTGEEIRAFRKAKDRESVDDFFAAKPAPATTAARRDVSFVDTCPSTTSTEPPCDRAEASPPHAAFEQAKVRTMSQMREEPMKDARDRIKLRPMEEGVQHMEERGMPVRKAFQNTTGPQVRTGASSSQPPWSPRPFGRPKPMREQMRRLYHLARDHGDSQTVDAVRSITREVFRGRLAPTATSPTPSSSDSTTACPSTTPPTENISAMFEFFWTTDATASPSPRSSSPSDSKAPSSAPVLESTKSSVNVACPSSASQPAANTSTARPAYFFPRLENFHAFNSRTSPSSTAPSSLFPPPRSSSLLPPQPQDPIGSPRGPLPRVPRSDSASSLATTIETDGASGCESGSTISFILDASDDADDSDWEVHREGYQVV